MLRTSFRIHSSVIASVVWSSVCFLGSVCLAQSQPPIPKFVVPAKIIAEGRSAAPLLETETDGHFERRRLKRTVSMDPTKQLSASWDRLYENSESSLIKAVYCNWDSDYLYVAVELSDLMEVRVDLDGTGDGWFRGVDNLAIKLTPDGLSNTNSRAGVRLKAERFDTVQNRDRPVWAASPVPEESIRAAMGRFAGSSSGACALVAIPRTELIGLERRSGHEFGIRIDAGAGVAASNASEIVAGRTLLKLMLADESSATIAGLSVKFIVKDRRLVPGERLFGTLEVRNETKAFVAIPKFFYGGSLSSESVIPCFNLNELSLNPGERLRQNFALSITDSLGTAAFVLSGGVELSDGQRLIALTSIDRIDPFSVDLDFDDKPVSVSSTETDRKRLAMVNVRSHSDGKKNGTVTLELPEGWTADGALARPISLSFNSEVKSVSFKFNVPPNAAAGDYKMATKVEIGGRVYNASALVRVIP
jgi:hypothetical protein